MIRKNKKIIMILFLASGLLLGGCSLTSGVCLFAAQGLATGLSRLSDKNRAERKPLIGEKLDGVYSPHGGSGKEWFKEPTKESCASIDAERRGILPEECKKNNETKNN